MISPQTRVAVYLVSMFSTLSLTLALPAPAAAQEMCGDGTTFTVTLPSVNGGSGDSLELPNGCRIYALIVSGYSRNNQFDELTFYTLARFVAAHDGYVHWAWWNNILKPYLAGPAHSDETFVMSVPPHTVFHQAPGGLTTVHLAGFAPASHLLDIVPKGVPEEDFQFQADARRMLAAIRANNPHAIVVVAGHSMGGNSVARLGANTPVAIDLLAPIDPVGNRSVPVGRPTLFSPIPDHTFNWTRWRATHEFSGYRLRDCVRNALFLCRNFGTLLYPEYHCTLRGPLLVEPPPPPGSLAPLVCPGYWTDPGRLVTFSGRIRRLYYRWQTEAIFPFDFPTTYYFGHWAPRNAGGLTTAINVEQPVVSCALGIDPLDPTRLCTPTDGHGELLGFRTSTPGQPNPPGPNVPVAPLALQALQWPQYDEAQSPSEKATNAAMRRSLLLELGTATDAWPHRPINPYLDFVSGDMVAILELLLVDSTPTAPLTVATPTPGPNGNGWNNEDVIVTLTATAGPGRAITEIEFSLAGAQTDGPTIHYGDTVDVPISAEGDTTVTFFARDDGGQVEAPKEVTIRLDKTPPSISATPVPPANANGWNNTDVTVTFAANDALSGVETVSSPVTLTSEGASQEVIGTASDFAGNSSAAVLTVNIDKTAPLLVGLPVPGCLLWPANQTMVPIASVSADDALSGAAPETLVVTAASSEPDSNRGGAHPDDILVTGATVQARAERDGGGTGRTYTVSASVQDLAGNVATASGSCFVPHDRQRQK